MPLSSRTRLEHMLTAAEKARNWCRDESFESLQANEPLALALVKLIEIIGEAARHVSEPDRAALPAIPWPDVVAMRHNLVHLYFGIDYRIVWDTIQRDLPLLIHELLEHLQNQP